MKSDKAGTFAACSPLDRQTTWTCFNVIYLPSNGFPLPNCHFTKDELSTIQRKAYRAIYAKCGFNQNTKRIILHGPNCYGGANFRHLYSEQGVGQILTFLQHWRTDSIASNLLRTAVAWNQLSLGTGTSFLIDVTTPHPHQESKWLSLLRRYLEHIDGTLELDEAFVPPLQREHDFYLMDSVIRSGKFTPAQIKTVNYCRLYLQAVTVSDISMPDGRALDPQKRNGYWSLYSSRTTLKWIKQERPHKRSWGTWQRACDMCAKRNGRLHSPLGSWLHPITKQRMSWNAYYDQDTHSLSIQEDDTTTSYFLSLDITADVNTGIPHPTPPTAQPITVTATREGWQIIGPIIPLIPSVRGNIPGTFNAYLQSQDAWELQLFECFNYQGNVYELCHTIQQTTFNAASDGSVYSNRSAAFGWILSIRQDRLVRCSGPSQGHKPTSYRAEAYGMLSFLRFLYQLQTFCQCTQLLGGTLVCDNLSLVNNVTGKSTPVGDNDIPEPLLTTKWTRILYFRSQPSPTEQSYPTGTFSP